MFRNREIRRLAVWFAGVTIVCSGAGFALQPGAGLLLLAAAAAYGAAFFLFTRARYRSIAKISEQIDQVLHDGDCLYIGEMDEGELSILQTEISKMTLRIREQNDALKKEKGHLADSLADIAHQLRTPLTSANLILSLLKDNPGESGRKGLLRDMEGLFRQMDRLIDSLLKLSRLDAGIVVFRKEPVQVAGLIETASRPLLIPMELHEITLEIQVPEGARIDGDPDWLGEALQNILKNCMESVGDRGCIQIACEDTLTAPQHWDDEPFELIVSNPPYSIKWAGDGDATLINDPRFAPAGVLAPKSKADLAFIMHSLSWLAANGTAAIVCFPGIMYRGGAEKKIRQYLIDNNFVACVIQLPANLFFGTSIATCIMVLKKGKADNKTLFVDASGECVKVTNNNRLTAENIERIVSVFTTREEIRHFSHLAEYSEISGNDYNLSVSTYVEAEDTREKIDIVKLNAEIEEIVAREQILREEIAKIIAEIEVAQ